MQQGVPFEAIFGPVKRPMSSTRRLAFVVACGEAKRGLFDWNRMRWDVAPQL